MSPRFLPKPPRYLTSPNLAEALMDFMFSRQSKKCTEATLEHYKNTATKFLLWAEEQGCTCCDDLSAPLVRRYLAGLDDAGKQDTTMHTHARGIKTLVRYLHKEQLMSKPITFDMPKLAKKRLTTLNIDQLRQVISVCNTREKAIVLFMADSGLRNTETCALHWGDINMENGLIRIKQGKGQKDRSAVVGALSRRALLRYRRTIKWSDETPLFPSRTGDHLTRTGLLLIYRRISKKANIHIYPHAMRRTFVILALRRDMDVGHIQAMLGHSDLTMVYHYAQLIDEDLIRAHKDNGPIDGLF